MRERTFFQAVKCPESNSGIEDLLGEPLLLPFLLEPERNDHKVMVSETWGLSLLSCGLVWCSEDDTVL